MATSETVVSVRDLRKIYGRAAALDGITFDVERGETFALLGPNGAGKSTAVEILEGYRDCTSGDARVLGVDPQRGGLGWKSRLGIVLQETGESGNFTVREQLAHFASFYANPRPVDEIVAAVGLEGKESTLIRKLSGGQRRRVDVALGMVGRPELLFLDEPTTGFDPAARRHFWEVIRGLKREGTTILLTTHYLDEAAQLGDRAGIIAGGRLIDIGPIDEIGGADSRVPLVRWRDGSGAHEERTTEPGAFVTALMEHGERREPDDLEVIRPTLEEIYLNLLRVHDASEAASASSASAEAEAEAAHMHGKRAKR